MPPSPGETTLQPVCQPSKLEIVGATCWKLKRELSCETKFSRFATSKSTFLYAYPHAMGTTAASKSVFVPSFR